MNWNRPDRPPTRTLEISDRFVLLAWEGQGFRSNRKPCRVYTHSVFFIRNLQTFLNWFSLIKDQTNLGNAFFVPTKSFPHRKPKHSLVSIFICLVDINPVHMFVGTSVGVWVPQNANVWHHFLYLASVVYTCAEVTRFSYRYLVYYYNLRFHHEGINLF